MSSRRPTDSTPPSVRRGGKAVRGEPSTSRRSPATTPLPRPSSGDSLRWPRKSHDLLLPEAIGRGHGPRPRDHPPAVLSRRDPRSPEGRTLLAHLRRTLSQGL